jgi:hypothetical protein
MSDGRPDDDLSRFCWRIPPPCPYYVRRGSDNLTVPMS